MRTIRRVSYPLNQGKWDALVELVQRYAGEKDAHLIFFGQAEHFASHLSHRSRRDELVRSKYISPHGLQARTWKTALKDAHETVSKWWCALAANLRPRVAQQAHWSEAQKHYAYWLLKSPQRLAQLVDGRAPEPGHFEVKPAERQQVRNYLRRVIRRSRTGKGRRSPRVKQARSAVFDANMYQVFAHDNAQYIKVMSLVPRQRIVIPLTGDTPIRGTIRLVLDAERQRVEIHYTVEVKSPPPLAGEACGLDAGVSEVFTDERGQRYGTEFGRLLDKASEQMNDKGRKRNKLHQLAKKAAARGDHKKARNIRRFNLGRKKLNENRRKLRAEMARQINTATNQVLRKRQPSAIITERLNIRCKAVSKHLSRQISLWARGVLKERVEFKALAGGSSREQVNPAYSSQTCPVCGFIHKDNRRGDTFQCLHCGNADDADRVAAHNLKARRADPEIHLWTPKERVRAILLDRFNAHLEPPPQPSPARGGGGRKGATVSGRTPGARGAWAHHQPESETAGTISPCACGRARKNTGAKCDCI